MSAKTTRDHGGQRRPPAPHLPGGGYRLSDRELDARLRDAAVELVATELPSLARAVQEARRRLGLLHGGNR
ncbi:MAG: hypothetical protein JXB32_18185 [Deltaproteobacteria bacterium]|nr:hypothetical protein [Deltaproteobacteria bacterium]